MKNLKIGTKLLVTFGTIFILFFISILIAVFSLMSNRSSFDQFYVTAYKNTNTVMDMRRAIQASAKYAGYAIMETDETIAVNYYQNMKEEAAVLQSGIDYLEKNFKGDPSLVRKFEDTLASFEADKELAYDLGVKNQPEEATALYFAKVHPGFTSANQVLEQIFQDIETRAEDSYTSARNSISRTVTIMMFTSLFSVGVLLVTALYLTRSLTAPIKELEHAARNMSEGHLKTQLKYTSRDEYGILADSMRSLIANISSIIQDMDKLLSEIASGNFDVYSRAEGSYVGDFSPLLTSIRNISDRLSDAMTQISISSEQVSSGSEQVSSGAQALSQGATEQASSVEELAATINEISEQVKDTASHAQEADKLANLAGESMAVCDGQMQDMINAMSEISTASGQISKIIKTIEDIAFQTNILALNAAVEAARAGEAGKGFAVVADEVRNLAGKSAEASKNTASLIEGSVAAVDKGTHLVNATAETLLNVVQNAKDVSSYVGKIAEAANNQAVAIAQITQGIDQISSVVQTNSATAEESAASSEELSGQAQMLKGLVGRFTLKHGSSGSSHTLPAYVHSAAPVQTESISYNDSMSKY